MKVGDKIKVRDWKSSIKSGVIRCFSEKNNKTVIGYDLDNGYELWCYEYQII